MEMMIKTIYIYFLIYTVYTNNTKTILDYFYYVFLTYLDMDKGRVTTRM